MPTVACAPSFSAITSSLLRRPVVPIPAFATVHFCTSRPFCSPTAAWRRLSCQVTLTTDVYSPFSPEAVISGEWEAACKIGARIRVKVPVKVFHVTKAPELNLCGMEGVIKQYVGVFKGKRVSANLPFKVEFFLPLEGHEKPIKFFAHLREDEFELL